MSKVDEIVDQLRVDIIKGDYGSNSSLTEKEIANKFGGSKTPAREALSILCTGGLLEKIPNVGYIVRRYSIAEIQDLLEYRRVIENAIIESAIERATESDLRSIEEFCDAADRIPEEKLDRDCVMINREFHVKFAQLSKNSYLSSAMELIMDQSRVALGFDNNKTSLFAGHREIIRMIREKDLEAAYRWANRFLSHLSTTNGSLVGCFVNDYKDR